VLLGLGLDGNEGDWPLNLMLAQLQKFFLSLKLHLQQPVLVIEFSLLDGSNLCSSLLIQVIVLLL